MSKLFVFLILPSKLEIYIMVEVFKAAYVQGNVVTLNLNDSFCPNNALGTIGFFTSSTVPKPSRTITYYKDEKIPDKDEDQINNAKMKYLRRLQTEERVDAIILNIFQIFSYFPVLGLIPFVVKLVYPLLNKKSDMHAEPQAVKISHYIRGAASGLGLGSIFIIPDICVTMHRFLKA